MKQSDVRVAGSSLKAAIYVHGQKQLSAMGVTLRKGGFAVKFNGKGAYACWRQDPATGMPSEALISYPAIADNGRINRREADLFAAYTLHEAGHIVFTDNALVVKKDTPRNAFLFRLWNGIEDARMEHAVIASKAARGARSMFKRLTTFLTSTTTDQFNPTALYNAPYALALICRAALGNGNAYCRTLLKRIPEPKRTLYTEVAARMTEMPLDRSGTAAAFRAAEWFLNEWEARFGAIELPEFVDGPVKGHDVESDNDDAAPEAADDFDDRDDNSIGPDVNRNAESGESDSDPLPLPMDDEDEGDEDSDLSHGNDDDAEYGDDDVYGDDGDDEDFDLDGEGDGESEEERAEREAMEREMSGASEEVDVPSQRASDEMFNDADENADEEGDDEGIGEGNGFSEAGNGTRIEDLLKGKEPEPDLSEVAQRINERTRNAIFLPDYVPAHRSDMSKWNMDVTERTIRQGEREMSRAALPAIKAQLGRLLKAPERCGWDAGAYSGRFNTRRQSRMVAGAESVFKTRWETAGIDTALHIIIDMSSSMANVFHLAIETAYTIASAAEGAGCRVEVSGFSDAVATTRPVVGGNTMGGDWEDGVRHNSVTGHGGTLVVMKPFGKKTRDCGYLFKRARRLCNGSTPDYACIRTAAEVLSERPEQRKVVLVLTDGCGYVDAMEQLTSGAQQLLGVEVLGVAIGIADPKSDGGSWIGNQFERSYKVGAYCPDRDALSKTALRTLIKHVESTIAGRRVM